MNSRAYFDEVAGAWRQKYETSRYFRRRRETILALLDEWQGMCERALDYGCGAGVLSAELAQRFVAVVAVDRSPAMRQAAQTTLASSKNAAVLAPEQLGDAAYDFILCSSVIEYVEDDAGFLRTLGGLLDLGGALLITFPNRWGPLQMVNRYALKHFQADSFVRYQVHTYTEGTICSLAAAAGLRCEKVVYEVGVGFFPRLNLSEQIFVVMGRG